MACRVTVTLQELNQCSLSLHPAISLQLGEEGSAAERGHQVILKLNVTSKDIVFFKKGATATIDVAGEKVKGKVTLIPLAANSMTRFFPVEVTFPNKKKQLLPGMYVTAELDARNVKGIIIPIEAIVYRNGVNTVWTVTAEGKAKRKVVKLGVQTKGDVQILEGLEDGDQVMVEGQFRMNDGDKVLIIE